MCHRLKYYKKKHFNFNPKINTFMRFEELLKQCLNEAKEEKEELLPWSLEITNNPEKSEEYNLLGKLIIKLHSLRCKID
jgi:hypothetical protein